MIIPISRLLSRARFIILMGGMSLYVKTIAKRMPHLGCYSLVGLVMMGASIRISAWWQNGVFVQELSSV